MDENNKRSAFKKNEDGEKAPANVPKFDINGVPLPSENQIKYEYDAGLETDDGRNDFKNAILGFFGFIIGCCAGGFIGQMLMIENRSLKGMMFLGGWIGYYVASNGDIETLRTWGKKKK